MEVASLAVGIIGIIVTAAGFVIAIIQLQRTATAAIATKEAVERTEQRTALNHLLVLLPQFRLIESDLDYAAESQDRKLTMRALVAFAHIASEVAVLMRGQDAIDDQILDELEATARSAARVKAELVTSQISPGDATSELRVKIGQIAANLTGVSSHIRMEAGRA